MTAKDDIAKALELADVVVGGRVQGEGRALRRRKNKAVRRQQMLAWRVSGMTYEEIGNRLGVTGGAVASQVTKVLAESTNQDVATLRALEGERLDAAQEAIWGKVMEGDVRAVDTFLKLSARRAKMMGMDEPQQVQVSMSVRAEMEEALAGLEQVVLHEPLALAAPASTTDSSHDLGVDIMCQEPQASVAYSAQAPHEPRNIVPFSQVSEPFMTVDDEPEMWPGQVLEQPVEDLTTQGGYTDLGEESAGAVVLPGAFQMAEPASVQDLFEGDDDGQY